MWTENGSFDPVYIPMTAARGSQTQHMVENFSITSVSIGIYTELITALAMV